MKQFWVADACLLLFINLVFKLILAPPLGFFYKEIKTFKFLKRSDNAVKSDFLQFLWFVESLKIGNEIVYGMAGLSLW